MPLNDISIEQVIIYLRKSRSDDPNMTVEEVVAKHEEELQEYAVREFGERIPENQIFREVVSGETIDDRPVMLQLMKLLETGGVKGVLVIEPQRLSRGDLQDCGRIINSFRYTNTLVMTPPKTYNLLDEYDRKFFEMELTRGNDYLEYTKKILNRGRIASVKKGNFIGSFAPYGYKKVKEGTGKDACYKLEVIPEEAEIIKLMYHLFVNEGYGFTKVARHLDSVGAKPRKTEHWSPAALKDMLENPVYIGKVRWNWRKTVKVIEDGKITKVRPKVKDEKQWIYVDGKHEAIIDEATFQAALNRRGKNPALRKNKELVNPFARLLYCGTCGRAMSYKEFRDKRSRTDKISRSMLCNNQAICKTKSVQYDAFFERVLRTLEQTIADFEIKLANNGGSAAKLHSNIVANLEMELQKLKAKDARQKDAYEDGTYTKEEYASRNAKLQEQIGETMKALCQAKASIPPEIDYEEKLMRFKDCYEKLQDESVSAAEKNLLLSRCIEKIIYYNHNESKAGVGRYVDNPFELDIFLRL
nr:MAG TPA: integrase [Caudoviricetes sp.]